MADTLKSMNSNESDDHQGKEEVLQEHAETQRLGHENDVRARKGLPPNKPLIPPLDGQDEEDTKNPEEFLTTYDPDTDSQGIDKGHLIVARRIYQRDKDFLPEGKTVDGDEYVAHHRRIRRERKTYRDTTRSIHTVGEVTSERKGAYMHDPENPRFDKLRRAPGVMQSMIVRLMPHEAIIAGPLLNQESLDEAVDETVRAVAQALGKVSKTHGLGCEILSAVVHRMGKNDLHIHIQFTMIVEGVEEPKKLGERLAPWKKMAAGMARAALKAEGVEDPHPLLIGAMKKKLIEDGELEPQPVANQEFRKFAGKRSLGKGHILNYSFRQKLNLVRAAEEGGRPDLAHSVTAKHDEAGNFRRYAYPTEADKAEFKRKLKMETFTEEDAFLDVWTERTWRNAIKGKMPPDALQRMVEAGVAAAEDYARYGTVMVEQTHINTLKKEQAAKDEALDAKAKALDNKAATLLAEIEGVRKKEAAELALAESARSRAEETARKQAEPILAAARRAEAALPNKEAAAELRGFRLAFSKLFPGRKSKAETVEGVGKDFDAGVEGIRQAAEIGAWAKVLSFLGKDKIQTGATAETLEKDAKTAISDRIATGLAAGLVGFFRVFDRDVPEMQTTEAVDNAIMEAGEAFKAGARREGLLLAAAKIKGVEVSEVEGTDETGLTGEIEMEAKKFHSGVMAQSREAVIGLAKHIFGGRLAQHFFAKTKNSVEMMDLLRSEIDRRGEAEKHLERALPLLDQHAPEIAEGARLTLAARPKLSDVPVTPAVAAARKTKKDKPSGDSLPGGLV